MAKYRLQILDSTVNGKATLAVDTALGQLQVFVGENAPSGKVCEFSTSENLNGFSLNVSDAVINATNAMSVRFWVKVAGDWVHIAEKAISFTAMTDYTVYFDWPIGETSPGISNTPAPMTKAGAGRLMNMLANNLRPFVMQPAVLARKPNKRQKMPNLP